MEWISTPTTGRQPEPCSFHTCTAVGNRVVVFGGRSLENAHFDDLHIFDTGDSIVTVQLSGHIVLTIFNKKILKQFILCDPFVMILANQIMCSLETLTCNQVSL